MNWSIRFPLNVSLIIGLLAIGQANVSAQDQQTGADYLSESTAAYFAINQPGELIDQILEHPLREKLEQLEDVRKGLRDLKSPQVKTILALFESQIGEPWLPALKSITAKGIFGGFDAKTSSGILLVHADDEAKLKRVLGTTLKWLRTTAESEGREVPYTVHDYRVAKVAKFDKFLLARIGSWLIVSNNKDLSRAVADRMIDGKQDDDLSDNSDFKLANAAANQSHQAWGFVDMELVRQSKKAKKIFESKLDDAAAELILGGLVSAIRSAPYTTLGVSLSADELVADLQFPFDPDSIEEPRMFYFGEDVSGQAPKSLVPKNLIANLSTYRDIGAWWLAKEDLYEEQVIANLAEADSNLSTVFGGVDFGQDVLSAIEPEIQIVVARQTYKSSKPEIKLPAFAMVSRLKDPEHDQRRFKVAFQSVIGFANLALAQQDQPQLEMESERIDGAIITSASYFSMQANPPEGLMMYNFSPSVSFVDNYMIISSTRELAAELMELARNGETANQASTEHTLIEIDANELARILSDNRQALITQQMLEKGRDAQSAENEIETLFQIMEVLDRATIKVTTKDNQLRAKLNAAFK